MEKHRDREIKEDWEGGQRKAKSERERDGESPGELN